MSNEGAAQFTMSYHDWLIAAGWHEPDNCPWNLRDFWRRCEDPKKYSPYEMAQRSDTSGT